MCIQVVVAGAEVGHPGAQSQAEPAVTVVGVGSGLRVGQQPYHVTSWAVSCLIL